MGSLPLNAWQRNVLQAFSKLRVSSLATFSSRHPPSFHSNFTAEGYWGTRCFERALLCYWNYGRCALSLSSRASQSAAY